MKKIVSLLIATLILVVIMPISASAESGTQGLAYKLSSDSSYYIVSDYTGSESDVVIPSSYNGLAVKEIGTSAFYENSVTSVTIPASVVTIESYAFTGCSLLTAVTIPNSVVTIESDAFYNCGVYSVIISDSVTTIGDSAFSSCKNLTEIVIPASVQYMGLSAFSRCDNLTDIYCEAASKPAGWDDAWTRLCTAEVHWGYTSSGTDNTPPETQDAYILLHYAESDYEQNGAPYVFVCKASGVIIEIAHITDKSAVSLTIPRGGMAVSFSYSAADTTNQLLYDLYTELLADVSQTDIINRFIAVETNKNLTVSDETLWIGELPENLGDVNADGTVDQFDYLLVKRSYFGTYVLSEDELIRADVNLDGYADQFDYVLLKRIYFGTYTI